MSSRCNGQSFPETERVAIAGVGSAAGLGRGSAGREAKPLSLLCCLPRTPGARLCTLGSSNPPAHSLCLSLELLQRVRKKTPEKLLLYCDSGSLPSLRSFSRQASAKPCPSGGRRGAEWVAAEIAVECSVAQGSLASQTPGL